MDNKYLRYIHVIFVINKNMFESSSLRFLKQIKNEVSSLPWEIWEESDVNDPNYSKKRKNMMGKVMHIDYKLQGYITKKYGNGELLKELSHYSFFTKGFIANTFNVVNNDAWREGKSSFLCFVDKLIDFAECEDIIESEGLKRTLLKLLILLATVVITSFVVFSDLIINDIIFPFEFSTKLRVFIIVGSFVLSTCLLWKDKKDVTIPICATFLGALLDWLIS